jgi:hypothetical protein
LYNVLFVQTLLLKIEICLFVISHLVIGHSVINLISIPASANHLSSLQYSSSF